MIERLAGEQELKEFRAEVRAWLSEHRPAEPDFLLPESFMEVDNPIFLVSINVPIQFLIRHRTDQRCVYPIKFE